MRRIVVQVALYLALLPQFVLAETSFYSFQLGSFLEITDAVRAHAKTTELPQARIERIGKYYVLRVGLWKDEAEAERFGLREQLLQRGYLRKVYSRPEWIIPSGVSEPLEGRTLSQASTAESERLVFHSFQLGSFPQLQDAARLYERAKTLPDARIEKIGRYYTVRFGFWETQQLAEAFHATATQITSDAFVRTVFADRKRMLKSSPRSLQKQEEVRAQESVVPFLRKDGIRDFHVNQDREYVLVTQSAKEQASQQVALHNPSSQTGQVADLVSMPSEESNWPEDEDSTADLQRDLLRRSFESLHRYGSFQIEDERLTVDLHGAPLNQILQAMSYQTGIPVLLSDPANERVTIQFANIGLTQGLERILTGRNYLFIYEGADRLLRKIEVYSRKK